MRNIIVITLLCSTLSHAYAIKRGDGQEIDRILHWVEDHSEDHVSECLDSLLKAERLSHRVESFKSRVKVLLSLSRFTLVRLNNLERCHLYLEEVRKMAQSRQNDPWTLSQYHNGRGVMFFHEQSDRKKALQEFRKAQYLCQRFSLPKDPMLLNNYGLVFLSSDQAGKALQLFREAATIAKKNKEAISPRFVISNTLNIGVCYIYLNDINPDISFEYSANASYFEIQKIDVNNTLLNKNICICIRSILITLPLIQTVVYLFLANPLRIFVIFFSQQPVVV
jgi:tetratricopeptide (TPR) repeat protein